LPVVRAWVVQPTMTDALLDATLIESAAVADARGDGLPAAFVVGAALAAIAFSLTITLALLSSLHPG
jgi:hypothetical protein